MITKMLLIRTAANAGGGFKFVVSLNIFTTVHCTEPGVEGFNRVTPISSTHFLIYSCRSQLIFLSVVLCIHLNVLCPLRPTLLPARYLTHEIDADSYSQYLPNVRDRLGTKFNLTPKLAAVLSGHGKTRAYLHRFKIREDATCICGQGEQTKTTCCSTT
jgi:hypothetical protein